MNITLNNAKITLPEINVELSNKDIEQIVLSNYEATLDILKQAILSRFNDKVFSRLKQDENSGYTHTMFTTNAYIGNRDTRQNLIHELNKPLYELRDPLEPKNICFIVVSEHPHNGRDSFYYFDLTPEEMFRLLQIERIINHFTQYILYF